MRFKPGQKVVTAYKSQDPNAIEHTYKPKLGEIVTVKSYCGIYPTYIYLVEYSTVINGCVHVYPEECFEPLMDISELEAILQSEPATV